MPENGLFLIGNIFLSIFFSESWYHHCKWVSNIQSCRENNYWWLIFHLNILRISIIYSIQNIHFHTIISQLMSDDANDFVLILQTSKLWHVLVFQPLNTSIKNHVEFQYTWCISKPNRIMLSLYYTVPDYITQISHSPSKKNIHISFSREQFL